MSEVAVGISETSLHEIHIHDKRSWAWCRLLWEDAGRVIILSDWGCWSYYWGSIGNQSVAEFLTDLDIDYMGKKMLGSKIYEPDDKATAKSIKQYILETRRAGDMDKEKSRDEWNLACDMECGSIDMREFYENSTIDDVWEFGSTRIVPEWRGFWERMWIPHVVPALKQYVLAHA